MSVFGIETNSKQQTQHQVCLDRLSFENEIERYSLLHNIKLRYNAGLINYLQFLSISRNSQVGFDLAVLVSNHHKHTRLNFPKRGSYLQERDTEADFGKG